MRRHDAPDEGIARAGLRPAPGGVEDAAVRFLVGGQVVVLAYGGAVHVVQLATGGWPPYAWAPAWLAGYFTALTVLDPLAAGLLWARRRAGLVLSVTVLVTDAAANGYATYGLGLDAPAARIAQAVISVLALTALVTAPAVWKHLTLTKDR
ncbi:hypothetical protein [Dactylosporangium fulvum]|uniref:Integral membrane protein n=1 Tax=Dactylosporangium fulvum TaxID=53359 RepID=A0ABY5VM61_9ACTN|nr:hypothetical protein [Dactylosporangium fulvum]UWP78638.1 hypothetical protein Dfulv_26020 [Dactylosporangium fulvum]